MKTCTLTTLPMKKYYSSKRCAQNIRKYPIALLNIVNTTPVFLHVITIHDAHFPQINSYVIDFVRLARQVKIPITLSVLQACALQIQDKLNSDTSDDADRKYLFDSIKASRGWVDVFSRRHSLRSVSVHGQAGNALTQENAQGMFYL